MTISRVAQSAFTPLNAFMETFLARNVKDVWFDSYDEEGTLRSLAWTWTHLGALGA